MTDVQIRGYTISSTLNYIREVGGTDGEHAIEMLSSSTKDTLNTIAPATWYPVSVIAEINRAMVAAMGKNDEAKAREVLITCGKFMAREATNTFLRLLMRILTPTMLAKKFPDLWRRDCNSGRLEVSLDDQRLVCRYFDLPGFDHVGPVACGFAIFALEAMGKSIESSQVHDWSLAAPNVDGVSFELHWRT